MPQGFDHTVDVEMPTMKSPSKAQRTLCLCNTHATWGGGEKWHLETAKALVRRGWHIILLANPACRLYKEALLFADSEAKQSAGSLRLVPLKIQSLSFVNPCVMGRLVRFFRREKITTVLVGLPAEVKSVALAAKIAGVPRILYRRGSALPVRNSWLNRYLYGSVLTSLIVNSQQTRDLVFINNAHLLQIERIHLLPNGLDVLDFDASLAQGSALYRQHAGQVLIGNAGRLDKQKGQHYLLRMMPHLLQALPEDKRDIRLVIAGDGALRAELEQLARDLGITKYVHFAGFLSDLGSFWKSLDIFVLSSLWEGFGYVLIEAMAAELPVVAFGVSNIPELVDHGHNGLLVPGPDEAVTLTAGNDCPRQDDVEDISLSPEERLAKAVLCLIVDAPVRQSMGKAGYAYAVATYSQEQCMDSLEHILLS